MVKNHENFVHIKAYLENIDPAKLPSHVDWLLCDVNISPYDALPHLVKLVLRYPKLKGIFFTVKLGEKIWDKSETVCFEIEKIKQILGTSMKMKIVGSKQLPSNRQEVLVWGRTHEYLLL